MVSEFVCKYAMPGIGCNIPEMLILGILFILTSFVCIFFLWKQIRQKQANNKTTVYHLNIWFWVFMFIWMMYRGLIFIIPFNYTPQLLRFFNLGINNLLCLIPVSILVLLVCELLFMYTNPEIRSISLFRVVFIIFISVFLVVAIALSVVDTDDGDDPGSVLYLWHSCADLIVSLFVLFPSLKLIKAISYPVIQPEDATCIRWSKVGVWSFCIIYFIRCLYNALHFFEANPIGEWIDVELQKPGKTPSAGVRAYSFMFFIIFDYATALMSIAGVFTLYQHDLKFADDPFYAKIQKINSGPESYEQ